MLLQDLVREERNFSLGGAVLNHLVLRIVALQRVGQNLRLHGRGMAVADSVRIDQPLGALAQRVDAV